MTHPGELAKFVYYGEFRTEVIEHIILKITKDKCMGTMRLNYEV